MCSKCPLQHERKRVDADDTRHYHIQLALQVCNLSTFGVLPKSGEVKPVDRGKMVENGWGVRRRSAPAQFRPDGGALGADHKAWRLLVEAAIIYFLDMHTLPFLCTVTVTVYFFVQELRCLWPLTTAPTRNMKRADQCHIRSLYVHVTLARLCLKPCPHWRL